MTLFITMGEIMAMPFMDTFWTLRSNTANRGQYAGLYTIAWGTANALGPMLSTVLADATNFQVLFVVLGCILLSISFGFYKLGKTS